MKKCLMAAIGLMMAMSVNAQYLNDSKTPFTQGKTYVGASLSSTDLSYNGLSKGHLGINGKVGYFFADNLLGTAQVAYEKYKDVPYSIILGAEFDDLLPSVQVGYSFFINRTVTIEPELYYEQSFKNHKDYSQVGLRIGIGIYLFKDTYKNIR